MKLVAVRTICLSLSTLRLLSISTCAHTRFLRPSSGDAAQLVERDGMPASPGLRSHKKKKKKSHKKRQDLSPLAAGLKLLKYSAAGSLSRVSRLLSKVPHVDLDTRDSYGDTPLHKAAICGSAAVAEVLLATGCDASVQNGQGNTAAHLAGLRNFLPVLLACLRSPRPPNIDSPNDGGVTVRDLVERLLEGGGGALGSSWPMGDARSVQQPESRGVSWEERLAMERSDGEEEEGGGFWEHHSTAGLGAARPAAESEDAWANRLFQEMQQKRRRETVRAFADWQALHEAELRQKQRQQDAASESQRILREEVAKDAAWRRSVQARQAPDIKAHCAMLEAKWLALEARGQQALPIRYADVPWVLDPEEGQEGGRQLIVGPMLPAALDLGGRAAGGGALKLEAFAEVVLHGASGADEVKRRLRREILRWHPDKFVAKFGARLAAEEREAILAGVKSMSQMTTQLMQGGG